MNWFWCKKKEVVEDHTDGMEAARQAMEKSQRDVARVENLIKEVRPVMRDLHERREQNGFTKLWEAALRGEGEQA